MLNAEDRSGRRGLLLLVGLALTAACGSASRRTQRALPAVGPKGTGLPALPPDVFASPSAGSGPLGIPLAHPGSSTVLQGLPGKAMTVALTVDDGTDATVIEAYTRFAAMTGLKLTFFPNGINRGWTEHKTLIRPLVESGQVQVGNHTWSHPDLTRSSEAEVVAQIEQNETFIQETYGITARPYLRPPYGAHDPRVDAIAASLGYTSITLWDGTLGDSALLSADELLAQTRRWIGTHRIVLGHANHPTVSGLLQDLLDLVQARGLTTVTLDEAFGTSRSHG